MTLHQRLEDATEGTLGHTPGPEGTDDLRTLGVDFIYDADCWEATYDISDQDFVDDALTERCDPCAVVKVETLISGPSLYAARLPDERGEFGDMCIHYFASQSDAEAAIAKATASPDTGEGG